MPVARTDPDPPQVASPAAAAAGPHMTADHRTARRGDEALIGYPGVGYGYPGVGYALQHCPALRRPAEPVGPRIPTPRS